jgi:hypothetical protein
MRGDHNMMPQIPTSRGWNAGSEVETTYFRWLMEFVGRERWEFEVYPKEEDTLITESTGLTAKSGSSRVRVGDASL